MVDELIAVLELPPKQGAAVQLSRPWPPQPEAWFADNVDGAIDAANLVSGSRNVLRNHEGTFREAVVRNIRVLKTPPPSLVLYQKSSIPCNAAPPLVLRRR